MKQFSIGLTGLTTHQRALETSANNIANASTVGYKAGEYLFADQFSTFLSQTDAGKVGQGALEIGVRRNFAQGAFRKTGGQFDVAISGEGFLVTSPASDGSGQKFLTRNGQLAVDKDRFLVNSNGQFVYGRATYPSTGETSSTDLVPMSLPAETIEPQKTIDAKLQFNLNRAIEAPSTRAPSNAYHTTRFDFNPKDPSSFDYQTSVTVFDSVGSKHELRYYFRREQGLEVNQWATYAYLDDYALKLDSEGRWSAARAELDPASGEPRRDVRGAILKSVYEPGLQSTAAVGDTLNVGVSAASVIQPDVTLSNGIKIVSVTPGTVTTLGPASLRLGPDGTTLSFVSNGKIYAAAPTEDLAAGSDPSVLEFKNGDEVLCTISIQNTKSVDLTAKDVALSLYESPQTSSVELTGLTITSVNFGDGVVNGERYRIAAAVADGDAPDNLVLEQYSEADSEWVPTQYYAFAGNALESGASQSLSFTNGEGKTLMTVDLKNPTNVRIDSKKGDGTVPGIQDLLVTGFGDANDKGPSFEAKLASVRRPQAERYIFEVDPTTGAMLNSLDQPTAKIFSSLPNGAPDRKVSADGLIPRLSPSFKYTVRMGADAESTVDGIPFGGTNAVLDFEISQWEGTSVNSANAQSKSLQVGGRSLSRLTGLTIDPGGRMVASYSNGDVTYGGRLALANVPAAGGLIPVGSNLFQVSYFSGQATIGNPGDPGWGTIRSETVEDSNLDLAQELIRLTQLQRVYQANAKTISSADELMKTLLQV